MGACGISMGRQGISEHVHVLADLDALSCEAAEHIVRVVAKHAQGSGWVSIALGGGSTIRRLYELLAGASYRHRLPWDRVRAFWGDERCVPSDDPASNFGLAWQRLLSKVPIPSANLYRVPLVHRSRRGPTTFDARIALIRCDAY